MAGLSITGQMKVSTLQEGFLKEFGLTLRVYDGREFADTGQTLSQVRKKKGSGKALSVAKNMKVGNLEDKFEEEFGLKVQVAGSDDSYLCKDELTLNAAQQEDEKKLARKERKAARQAEASDDGDQEDNGTLNLDDYPESTHPHLSEIKRLSFVKKKSEEEIAEQLGIDELDVAEAVLMLEINSSDDSDSGYIVEKEHLDTNKSDDGSAISGESSELGSDRVIYIKGFGNEFLIGFIDDDEVISISEDEDDINEVIDELSERNEFLNIYGPDIEDCNFFDSTGKELDLPKEWDDEKLITENGLSIAVCVINMEACTYYKNDFIERIDELVTDEDNLHSKIPYFDIEHDGENIKNIITDEFGTLFIEKPTNEKFLIQKHVEKGDWGSLTIKNSVNDIVIFGLEIEGYTKLLLGYFYFEDNQIKFERYLADEVDTEGTSDHYAIYDAPKYDTIWEG